MTPLHLLEDLGGRALCTGTSRETTWMPRARYFLIQDGGTPVPTCSRCLLLLETDEYCHERGCQNQHGTGDKSKRTATQVPIEASAGEHHFTPPQSHQDLHRCRRRIGTTIEHNATDAISVLEQGAGVRRRILLVTVDLSRCRLI